MNPIVSLIIACEIAFWVVIVSGLAARYVFRRPRLGLVLLALTPLVDLALFAATAYDLSRGAVAELPHAIAAVYIGVSLAFGKPMIRWADERFRYYVVKEGEPPAKRYGLDYARHYFVGWLRHAAAFAIGGALLAGTTLWIGDAARTEALSYALRVWTAVLGIDLLLAASNFVWPKRERSRSL
ncbi:hypothetical protein MO973_27250 [Paenibacillus sp. TRM 82003]|nr:hypothetical protein [Paenibacillus sp. TRM 82003]